MLIDWFTVIAQVINFLILVWLLKRFFYHPMLNGIDAREERIATELAAADANKADAIKERDELAQKNEEFDQQRAALLNKVTDEVKIERQRLLEEARKDGDALRAKWKEALRSEQQNFSQEITMRIQQEVFSIARKGLTELADRSLEAQIVDVFISRQRELSDKAKEQLASVFKASPNPVLVRTTFDLSATQRKSIEETVKEIAGIEIQVQFEIAPNLISGIELIINGQKVGWSLAEYLGSLQNGVEEFLKEQSVAEIKLEPEPESTQELKPKPSPEQRANEHGT
jgi:F-type H+-transporting ATPase subunit b